MGWPSSFKGGESFLSKITDDLTRARLLAHSVLENGFMSPPIPHSPISNLSLRMNDINIEIAVGFHLGSSLGHPHQHHCNAEVNCFGMHSLSGKESEVCHYHHFSGLSNRPRCLPGSKCHISATQMINVQTWSP